MARAFDAPRAAPASSAPSMNGWIAWRPRPRSWLIELPGALVARALATGLPHAAPGVRAQPERARTPGGTHADREHFAVLATRVAPVALGPPCAQARRDQVAGLFVQGAGLAGFWGGDEVFMCRCTWSRRTRMARWSGPRC